jgi:LCP family protein required for cell wall assembly
MVPFNEYAWDSDIEVYVALGSDYGSWRIGLPTGTDNTDAFIIVILQYEPARISLISVPRDLYVFLPGFGMSRINTAWRHGGPEMVADTLRYNFGLPMDGFGYVRMEAFSRFIDDALHGLMVNVGKPVVDSCSDVSFNMLEGEHFMDGPTALCYGRIRAFDGGFNRQNRQRELLHAIKDKFLEIAADDPVGLASELVKTYISEHRYTDVGLGDVLRILPTALNAEIEEYNLDYEAGLVQFTHPTTGAWLVLPPAPACMSFLMDAAVLGSEWTNLPEACEVE